MTLLQVADLGFGYGADRLFTGVTFSVDAGDRVALVAPNGAGKSTLLRLVAGELTPDKGATVVPKGTRVGYYRQSHELRPEGDVMDAFLSGFREVMDLRHALSRAQHEAASGEPAALDRLAQASDAYHQAEGDELERKIEMLAGKLGFSHADMGRDVTSLSGGERGRLHLGVVLAQEPELLLLDEPTNHLDLDTISWLEQHLGGFRGGLVIVSHDRAFLDNVTTQTMELGRTSFRVYPLGYSAYAVARAEDLERERELAGRQQAFVAKTEDFIRKNIAGQKTKQAQSRRKMLDKLDRVERPEDVWAAAERVSFRFAPAPRSGDIVLDAKGLSASRGGRELFRDLALLVRRGDRVGVVGPNGAGKTTLLKLLAGVGGDDDVGDVRRGTNLAEGYFDQHLGSLDPSRTAVEEIRRVRGDLNVDGARQYLARFRFYGDDALRRVTGFSGGERSRLALAKLLLEPRNLLFLDEPTNHLDIPAAEILEEALVGFEGTVVLVSHDRRFLENVTTRIVEVRAGATDVYPGGFADFVDAHARKARAAEAAAPRSAPRDKPRAASSEATDRDARKAAAEPIDKDARKAAFEQEKQVGRTLERKKKRLAEVEKAIETGEAELATMRDALKADPGGDWAKLAAAAKREQVRAREVDAMMAEWSQLGDEIARLTAQLAGAAKGAR